MDMQVSDRAQFFERYSGESTDAWADFLADLVERGLACPLLAICEGARGLIAAIEQVFPAALTAAATIRPPGSPRR
jgi:hypothetical protein